MADSSRREKTAAKGVFREHRLDCPRRKVGDRFEGRCRGCSYVVRYRHRGRQEQEQFAGYDAAVRFKGQAQAGEARPVSRLGLRDYYADWIDSYSGRTARGFSETTRDDYRGSFERVVLPAWGGRRLADIEPLDVRQLFAAQRKREASTSAIRKLRAALGVMFATAVEDGLLRSNPVAGTRIPPALDEPEAEKPKALTRAELRLLLSEVPDEWRLFFDFLTHTGLRISEAIGLRWEHLDLGDTARVRVREQVYKGQRKRLKSSNGRRDVPLSPGMTARLLVLRRDTYRGGSSPVFASLSGGELNPSNVAGRVLKPAAIRAGFVIDPEADKPRSWISFHTLRHTCASLLFEAGKNIKQVQEWLGHGDPGFTLRTYVHLMDEGLGEAGFLDAATAQANARPTPDTARDGTETAPVAADLAA